MTQKILSDSQDKVLKRVQDLKQQMEVDRNLKKDQEFQFKLQLKEKQEQIDALKSHVNSLRVLLNISNKK
jgi:hypothetical protein